MNEQKFSLSGSYQKAKEYIDTQIELVRLKAIAKSSRVIGALVVDLAKLLLVLIIVFFLSLALGFYLGELLGSDALGFLATGGVFLVLLLLVIAFEPKLEAKFIDLSIRKILGKWNEEDEHLESMARKKNSAETKKEETIDDIETHEDKNQ